MDPRTKADFRFDQEDHSMDVNGVRTRSENGSNDCGDQMGPSMNPSAPCASVILAPPVQMGAHQ